MQEEIKTLIQLLDSDDFDFNKHQENITATLKEVAKQARINEFLANKYKTDYETTVQFLNSSIADIELKKEELLRVNMELERFAHVVSHDLKAPVRGILSFAGLLEKVLKDSTDERVIEYLGFIQRTSRQMNNLIRETLEHSKLGRDEMSIQEVDLQQILTNIEAIILNANTDYQIQIKYPVLPVVEGNKTMLHKLFQNIIQNGIKYNESDLRSIHLNYEEDDTHHLFTIRDNGIGISQKNIDRVFDMYTRLHSAQDYEGTGIGLAICKKIVENHSGTISVNSKVEKGSTFTFSLKKSLVKRNE